jgi:hypothetical protein
MMITSPTAYFSPFAEPPSPQTSVPEDVQSRLVDLVATGDLSRKLKDKIEELMKENGGIDIEERVQLSRSKMSKPHHIALKQIKAIENFLATVTELDLSNRGLTFVPKSIKNLINIEILNISCNHLIEKPDLSHNKKLVESGEIILYKFPFN